MEGSYFYLYSPATLRKYQSCFELEAIQPDSLSGISGVAEIERWNQKQTDRVERGGKVEAEKQRGRRKMGREGGEEDREEKEK